MSKLNKKQLRARKGGRAVISKQPPDVCPRCGESMEGRVYHSYLGHLGLHGLADKYFKGDIKAARKRLGENGRARQDPFKANGAWKPYVPLPVDVGGELMQRP